MWRLSICPPHHEARLAHGGGSPRRTGEPPLAPRAGAHPARPYPPSVDVLTFQEA